MNIRTVAAFTREDKIIEHFQNKMREPNQVARKNAHIKGFLIGLGQLFLFGSYTLSFWYGGKLVDDGEYDFVQVLKVFMAVVMIAMGVGQTASMAPDAAKAKRAAAVIFSVVDRKSPIDSGSAEGKKLDNIEGKKFGQRKSNRITIHRKC
jgi:ATP-binding cassette subfamily B (MDR/TAP) protein 1